METPSSTPTKPDISGLVAAITRNKDDDTLAQYLEPHRWGILADYLHSTKVPHGHILISQGGADRTLYFLESGSLKVHVGDGAGQIQLAILGAGSVVGEGCFFSHKARNATVQAYNDCKVWSLDPAGFAALSKQDPTVALALAMALGAIMATRMLDLSRRIVVT